MPLARRVGEAVADELRMALADGPEAPASAESVLVREYSLRLDRAQARIRDVNGRASILVGVLIAGVGAFLGNVFRVTEVHRNLAAGLLGLLLLGVLYIFALDRSPRVDTDLELVAEIARTGADAEEMLLASLGIVVQSTEANADRRESLLFWSTVLVVVIVSALVLAIVLAADGVIGAL